MKIEDLNISFCLGERVDVEITRLTLEKKDGEYIISSEYSGNNYRNTDFLKKYSKEILSRLDFEYKAEFIELMKTLK